MQVAELPRSVTATTAPSTQYDAVVVSTSPVCLMTALALRAQGKRVLLVDQSPIIGGAWITTDLGGFSNVEVGCHLIDPDPAVYSFMQGLGIPMQPLSPRPEILSRGPARFPQRIPYSHRWLRDLYDIVARPEPSAFVTLPRTNAKDILKHVYRVLRHAFKAVKGDTREILYPKGGCSEIVTRLAELVELSGVEVRTSTRLSEVSMDREAGVVSLRLNGEVVTAGAAYLPASVNLPYIGDGARNVPLDANKHVFQNLYLVLRDTGPLDLTYTLLYGDKLVHRVSDLTRFAKRGAGRDDGTVILGLTVDEYRTEDQAFADDCLARIKEYGFVPEAATMVEHHFLPYPFTWLEVSKRHWLRGELDPLVHILDTESMTRSIKNLLRDFDVAPLLAYAAAHPSVARLGGEAACA